MAATSAGTIKKKPVQDGKPIKKTTAKPLRKASLNREVFVNCPFDDAYKPLFRAAVYTVIRSGFVVRCALELDNSGQSRFQKICDIINVCSFGFHDISRTELDPETRLPRFNMPLELGLFLGYAQKHDKCCVIFDREPHRYQAYISDLAGQDIKHHNDSARDLVIKLTNWLRIQSKDRSVPGGEHLSREFLKFYLKLPSICKKRKITDDDMTLGDYMDIVVEHIKTLTKRDKMRTVPRRGRA